MYVVRIGKLPAQEDEKIKKALYLPPENDGKVCIAPKPLRFRSFFAGDVPDVHLRPPKKELHL